MGNLIARAKSMLLVRHAFFASLALNLEYIETEETETMATDGKAIYYNPAWVATLELIEIMSVIAHEVLHVAFCHHLRRNGRDQDRWNRACDYAINWILVESGVFRLPEGGLFDEQYKGMTAEQIYNKMPTEDEEDDPSAGSDPLVGEVWDATNDDGEPLTESEKASEEMKAQASVSEAMDAEKQVGIGEVDAAVREALEVNKIDAVAWYEQLAQWVTQYMISRSSFNTPDRRLLHTGHILPAATRDPEFHLVFAWDTSGSLTDELTGMIKAHINNAVQALNPSTVEIIYCDTRVRERNTFCRTTGASPIELDINPVGGGGTRFDPVFKYISDEDIETDCLVYFTDGIGQVNVTEPDYPVLWATTQTTPDFSAGEFGDSVTIK